MALHRQELRRGTLVVACLIVLRRPGYGYGLLEQLADRGVVADANTLYPLLRRLEKQGFLRSEWDTAESRPRKFYRTSTDGERLLALLLQDWRDLDRALTDLAAPAADPQEE